MKNTVLKNIILVLFVMLFFTIASLNGCKREIKPTTGDEKTARFISIKYGGCNNQSESYMGQRSAIDVKKDTVIFECQNDTLKVTVGINYICCSTFNTTQTVDENKISLLITETTSPEQYCRCECYYTFDYFFTDISRKSYVINVTFDAQDNNRDKNFSKFFNL
ncbi:MAG: hypothetical protein LBG92_06725 [Prevotellaceae bacterium]|jgi:hypothetical protein|nr:hypothetical protein [Prevotellaceae bacterium]